ncbi:MAG: hypothetical protein JXB15_05705 [Anaerolineales bacterium]|nr:hypothetical protein [Anaerolineales bacterium]
MKQQPVFHPFLLCLYPILALIAYNIDQVMMREIWRSLLATLICTGGLFGLLYLLTRNPERAGLVASLALILFFSYGHVYRLVEGFHVGETLIGRADYLAALWAIIFINLGWFFSRRLRKTAGLTRYLNLVTALALTLPVFQIGHFYLQNARSWRDAPQSQPQLNRPSSQDQLPDIYYIILDGYGREDVLDEIYAYDNSEFLAVLRQQGFYIADNSHANYAQTTLSLAASLNLEYVNDLAEQMGEEATSRDPLAERIQHSYLRAYLSSLGYQIVNLASAYAPTELRDADLFLNPGELLNSFESLLLSNTAAVLLLDKIIPALYRQRMAINLDALETLPASRTPRFVFAHLTIPHPPFVFGPQGESIPPRNFKEGNYYEGTTEEYIAGYRGQLAYLNQRLEQIVAHLLSISSREPVIILQGDHGPGALLNWDDVNKTCLKERMSIFNAYYLPGEGEKHLYPAITPVNSFRIILNTYFNAGLSLLEDRSYFSLWETPYQLIDVSDSVDTCMPISSR